MICRSGDHTIAGRKDQYVHTCTSRSLNELLGAWIVNLKFNNKLKMKCFISSRGRVDTDTESKAMLRGHIAFNGRAFAGSKTYIRWGNCALQIQLSIGRSMWIKAGIQRFKWTNWWTSELKDKEKDALTYRNDWGANDVKLWDKRLSGNVDMYLLPGPSIKKISKLKNKLNKTCQNEIFRPIWRSHGSDWLQANKMEFVVDPWLA